MGMNHKSVRRCGGFSMVEVLVALVVLSVGMLGVAGLYVTTLRASGSALFRTQAISLAADMADRIRANANAGIAYESAGADRSCVGGVVDCSATQMAEDDIFRWRAQIVDLLPSSQGAIDFTAGTPSSYTITVSWTEPGNIAGSYVLRMQI